MDIGIPQSPLVRIEYGPFIGQSEPNSNEKGTPVLDDPFDATRWLGIQHDDLFIPFETDGTTVYFQSHVSTNVKRAQCTWVVMTGNTEWDPSSV